MLQQNLFSTTMDMSKSWAYLSFVDSLAKFLTNHGNINGYNEFGYNEFGYNEPAGIANQF